MAESAEDQEWHGLFALLHEAPKPLPVSAAPLFDDASARLNALVGDNQYDVRATVEDLRTTAGNLRALSESLKRYPAGVLVGGPPERIQLPGHSP